MSSGNCPFGLRQNLEVQRTDTHSWRKHSGYFSVNKRKHTILLSINCQSYYPEVETNLSREFRASFLTLGG